MPTSEKEIDRIGDIIKNARGTWFVLLGSLVFAAITLASVKDASFFIASEQTKLPLLGISVPITSFFWAGALLITALYTYLHLYLVQLWDALGEADARIGDKPLADVIHPWLVSDAALRVRDKRLGAKRKNPYAKKSGWKNRLQQFEWWLVTRTRKCWLGFKYRWLRGVQQFKYGKRSSSQRGMSNIGNLVSILLVWVLGLAVIIGFWWRSMPAHDIWLTGWLGVLLVWSLYIFWRSGSNALARLEEKQARFPAPIWFGVLALTIVGLTIVRTHYDHWEGYSRINRSELAEGCKFSQSEKQQRKWCPYLFNLAQEFIRPARAEMAEVVFTQKPAGWTGFDLAKQEFRLRWCKQSSRGACTINPLDKNVQFDEKEEEKFGEAWKRQQEATLATFNKPDLRKRRLEGADLRLAKLEGVKLEKARLHGADFSNAQMRGVNLRRAQLQGGALRFAQLQRANLRHAELKGADFRSANLQAAVFRSAKMQDVILRFAEMQDTVFRFAEMQGAILRFAKMQGTNLRGAKMGDADLTGARMQGVVLFDAQLQGADFTQAYMQGAMEKTLALDRTDFSEVNFSGTSFRFVDFTGAIVKDLKNFEKSFGDGSVALADGMKRPAHWCERGLPDWEYYGRYQGWGKAEFDEEFINVDTDKYPLIRPSVQCPDSHHPW